MQNKQARPYPGAVDIVHSKRGREIGDTSIRGHLEHMQVLKHESRSKVKVMQNHEMSKKSHRPSHTLSAIIAESEIIIRTPAIIERGT